VTSKLKKELACAYRGYGETAIVLVRYAKAAMADLKKGKR